MTFAQVTANTITAISGSVPVAARRLDTGDWVLGLRDAPTALQEACGWYTVADVARPPDTPTTRFERSFEMVATVATMVWTAVPKTQVEQDAETDAAAAEVLRQEARDAIADLDAYLGLGSPTAAQVRQAVDFLARVSKRLIVDNYGIG